MRSFLFAAVVLATLPALGHHGEQQATVPPARDMLDAYAAGRYDEAERTFASSSLLSLLSQLQTDAGGWIAAGGSIAPRRRLVAASVALEAAGTRIADWDNARELIEWGCGILREGPPQPAERVWHLAAVALAEGAYDVLLLIGDGGHLNHAAARFPDEDRFALARAVAFETATWPMSAQARYVGVRHYGSDALKDLSAQLAPLLARPAIAREVQMRLGHTELRLGRRDRAIAHFARVDGRTKDPFLLYLARYFTGRAQQADRNAAAAAAAYRSALQAVPRAQSASLALAALSFTSGHRDEAQATLDTALGPTPVDDPWRTYQMGDYRFWAGFIDLLRRELR